MLSFFPRGVLDEILNLIESVSEDFPSYSEATGQIGPKFHMWHLRAEGIESFVFMQFGSLL